MTARPTITLANIRRQNGVAGNFTYTVDATYTWDDGTEPQTVGACFASSEHGSPVHMYYDGGPKMGVRVVDWRQHGEKLNPAWLRRFYAM